MNRMFYLVVCIGVFAVVLTGCKNGPSVAQLADTSIAQTVAAASPTPLPTNTFTVTASPTSTSTNTPSITPTPTETSTITPSPTPTSSPTNTPTITFTPRPTKTFTPTKTPGPFTFYDDFSTKNLDAWSMCLFDCEWKDGKLYVGPFTDPNSFHQIYCDGCGKYKFYRMSADMAFVTGQVDRHFGFITADNNNFAIFFGISPYQHAVVLKWDYSKSNWIEMISRTQMWTHLINASYGTNHLEAIVQPSSDGTKADYIFKINGKVAYRVDSQPVEASQVGLGIDWQAMGVWYDNFEFEEIEVK